MTDTSISSSGSDSGDDQLASDQTFLEAMRLVTPTERIVWLKVGSSSGVWQRCLEAEKVYRERGVGSNELIALGRKMAARIDKYLHARGSAKKSAF